MTSWGSFLGVAAAWGAYGLVHSWLASLDVKAWVARRWPRLLGRYRLVYNLTALLLLIPPLWLTIRVDAPVLWHWPTWISYPVALAVAAGFVWSMRWYDGLDFLGLRPQNSTSRIATLGDTAELVFSPLHRYVRHPWYAMGLLLLWTRDLNMPWLIAALSVTFYVLIGIRYEERKLEMLFGEAYRHYRTRVPALLPWPGRRLTATEVEALQSGGDVSASP